MSYYSIEESGEVAGYTHIEFHSIHAVDWLRL